ncbi:spore coat protein [Hazenella sp. IB182357]|uniref:Spore coat protein n=1 Tax=Polycladospora coralii TaxID=2771432 RepID=A0A926N717_9BACL|nr:spore coat protein [Polycladospora coralii]MBD1371061.1 spore coat protein [Polycladospora coralii]
MQQQSQMSGSESIQYGQVPAHLNHGAHEIEDIQEVLSSCINCMDQYTLYKQHCQSPELRDIIERQYQAVQQEYNTLLDCFSTGQDPQVPTQAYNMQQENNVTFGMQSTAPHQPCQDASQFGDQQIAAGMLDLQKSRSLLQAGAACEVTNPVVRRVLSASIPNSVEMAYEIFLYQNQNGFYCVPQFTQEQSTQLIQSFEPAHFQSTPLH